MGGGGKSAPKPDPAPEQSAIATTVSAKNEVKDTKKKKKRGTTLDSTLLRTSALGGNMDTLG